MFCFFCVKLVRSSIIVVWECYNIVLLWCENVPEPQVHSPLLNWARVCSHCIQCVGQGLVFTGMFSILWGVVQCWELQCSRLQYITVQYITMYCIALYCRLIPCDCVMVRTRWREIRWWRSLNVHYKSTLYTTLYTTTVHLANTITIQALYTTPTV